MNLLNKLLFLLLLLINSSNITTAQTPHLINYSDKGKLFDYQNAYIIPTIFNDYDNTENLWLSICDRSYDSLLLCKVDNNLNIERIISNKDQLLNFKYNNKNYGVSYTYSSNGNNIDSVFFYCNDSIGNNLTTRFIRSNAQDSFNYYTDYIKVFFSKEKNIVFMNYGGIKSTSINFERVSNIIVVDTLGNILNSNVYTMPPFSIYSYVDIIEHDNKFGLIYVDPDVDDDITKISYIDKETLNIVDSITFDTMFCPDNVTQINDSIFVSVLKYGSYIVGEMKYIKLDIFNINSFEVKKMKLFLDDNEDSREFYTPEFGKKVDFINPDSIYYCHYTRNTKRGTNYIDIVNFSINGNINFRYRIDYDSTCAFKQINGIKATTDGGVVIACSVYGSAWVIKFMPNGFVGLSNVESGEKASLRVYPNPAKDFVLVDIEADKFVEADIEIYDLGGRMVKSSRLSAKVGNRIDVSSLKAGVYTYRVVLNGKGVSGKIVIGE